MKSILHLKDDTEYQIPLREKDDKVTDRAKVDVATANPEVKAEKENKTDVKDQQNSETLEGEAKQVKAAGKKPNEISQEEVAATQSQDDAERPALDNLEEENPNQGQSSTENSSNDTPAESAPPADTAKAALDEMKKLASQEGVIHPSLFISNFSKILGLMERAMQLQVKESGSVTEESGSVTEEKAPETTEEKASEQTKTPAEGKQGELNGNSRS